MIQTITCRRPFGPVDRPRSCSPILSVSPGGDCTFACDPRADFTRSAPIWSAELDPTAIRARAHACQRDTSLRFEVDRLKRRVAISENAEHVLVRMCDASLRLDIIEGTILAGPAILEPSVAMDKLDSQVAGLRKLHSILRGLALPREEDVRLPRLVLALRAIDGRAEGTSLRNLACGIFGAREWPGDGESVKSRARRLVALSEKLQRAGPRGVLAGDL